MIKIAPSILAADFANLERDIQKVRTADYLHVDVMDGLFVPNISIGLPVVQSIRAVTDMPLDVHLMIDRPVRYAERFCRAGADIVTVHVEADSRENTRRALEIIRGQGKRAGVVLKPGTPTEAALPFLELCSMVLVMTVEPGFGGQSFMPQVVDKLPRLRQLGFAGAIEMDGGINMDNIVMLAQAGLDVAVMGTALYRHADPAEAIAAIHRL